MLLREAWKGAQPGDKICNTNGSAGMLIELYLGTETGRLDARVGYLSGRLSNLPKWIPDHTDENLAEHLDLTLHAWEDAAAARGLPPDGWLRIRPD